MIVINSGNKFHSGYTSPNKMVDLNIAVFYIEVTKENGNLAEILVKYPQDKGHQKVMQK